MTVSIKQRFIIEGVPAALSYGHNFNRDKNVKLFALIMHYVEVSCLFWIFVENIYSHVHGMRVNILNNNSK